MGMTEYRKGYKCWRWAVQ